ncbi:hypothetical protein M011DRAFT_474442 [Sporormia fimetaria CBS 119925]|uniref:Uncharacterized protein n=1 Tax=Sporormia fimetaria CBS 119925 TaxID=1340428 RepID=A0A6A6VP00_9PLEO|nr:hypothetical protein M011DRAFT_474442 [Sporormia fimetaria CBS 119925]
MDNVPQALKNGFEALRQEFDVNEHHHIFKRQRLEDKILEFEDSNEKQGKCLNDTKNKFWASQARVKTQEDEARLYKDLFHKSQGQNTQVKNDLDELKKKHSDDLERVDTELLATENELENSKGELANNKEELHAT